MTQRKKLYRCAEMHLYSFFAGDQSALKENCFLPAA